MMFEAIRQRFRSQIMKWHLRVESLLAEDAVADGVADTRQLALVGWKRLHQREVESAINFAEQSLEKGGDTVLAIELAAFASAKLEDWEACYHYGQRHPDIDNARSDFASCYAYACCKAGRPELAHSFLKSLNVETDQKLHNSFAYSLLHCEKFDEAISFIANVIGEKKLDRDGLLIQGSCYLAIGKFDQALDAYRKSLKIDPHNLEALEGVRESESAITGRRCRSGVTFHNRH